MAYVLDGSRMRWEADFHGQIQKILGFFEGYGWNLDALSDVVHDTSGLMSAKRPFELVWKDSATARSNLGTRFDVIIEILRTAPGITLVLR